MGDRDQRIQELRELIASAHQELKELGAHNVPPQLDEHVCKRQKLDAIATLAGGIAHEVNNPIQGIMNYAHLLEAQSQSAELKSFAADIAIEAEQIASMTRHLFAYLRADNPHTGRCDPADALQTVLHLCGKCLNKDHITIEDETEQGLMLPQVRCSKQCLMQVLLNLLLTSRDALNRRYPKSDPEKRIQLCTTAHADGPQVRISVQAQGGGIEESVLATLFELEGADDDLHARLRLAVSRHLISQHGGSLTAESDGRLFTRLVVELPAC